MAISKEQLRSLNNLPHRWDFLNQLIKISSAEVFVEVGVAEGKNMGKILRENKNLKCTAVDNWGPLQGTTADHWAKERHEENYKAVLALRERYPRLSILRGLSAEIGFSFPEKSADIIFIDGDHSYEGCLKDILAWLPALRPGGFFAGHDYQSPHNYGVDKAVQGVFGQNFHVFTTKSEKCKIWMRQI